MKHYKSRFSKIDDAIEFTDSELKKVEEVIEEANSIPPLFGKILFLSSNYNFKNNYLFINSKIGQFIAML